MDTPALPRDLTMIISLVVLLGFIVFVGIMLVRGFGRRRERRTRQTRAIAELGSRSPDCICCGQPAERPASRTGEPTWLDDMFPAWRKVSLRAQYRPAIPVDGIPSLCNLCGRAWDARLEHKVAEVVELAHRKMGRDVADQMNAYEAGELLESLIADLSKQRRKAKEDRKKAQTANLAAPPTGVNTVVVVDPSSYSPRGIAPEPVLDGPPPAPQAFPPSSASPVPALPPPPAMPSVRPPAENAS